MTLFRLGLMMFLQFFVWGAWFVSAGIYLPAVGQDALVPSTYAGAYFAAAVAPLFFTFLADRFIPAQIVLGGLHLVGGAILFLVAGFCESNFVVTPEGQEAIAVANASYFVWMMFAQMCCYAPTLGLTNAVAFNTMTDPDSQFPIVRVNGTIGWIAAGLAVGTLLKIGTSPDQFRLAGAASLLLGLYSFTLPNTPPGDRGKPFSFASLIGADAFVLLKDRSFLVFLVCSTLLCLPLSLYYSFAANFATEVTGRADVTSIMTLGQMSEVLFMVAMPWFFRRLGVKWMLMVGMLAWVVRYGLFAGAMSSQATWMILLGIIIHGICYDFFFVTGQLYVDKAAPRQIRSQAQGLLVLAIYGVGFTAGSYLSGPLMKMFPGPAEPTKTTTIENEAGQMIENVVPQFSIEWIPFWIVPAVFALAIAVVFALTFRNPQIAIDDEDAAEPLNESSEPPVT